MIDPVEFGKQMAAIVREATAPLVKRISELEKALSDVPRGIDVDAVAKSAAALIPAPADPEIDVDAIAKAAAELIPAPKDGADADMNALKSHLEDLVKDLPVPKDGADGKDADMAELKLHLAELVKHVNLPAPPSVDEVAAVFERRFSDLTLSWERQARDTFEKAVDRMPAPKDGRDALPLDSFDLSLAEDGRTVTVKMQAGETVLEKSLKIASVIDRGPYKSQSGYESGDAVTHGGSLWIAQQDAPDGAPGMGGKGWRLAVKKGRDGKDLRDNAGTVDPSKGVSIK